MNSINLIGNICNDVELKTTNGGKSVCTFNLAVKRPFSKETTDFIPVVCWGNQAEIISKFAHKGTKIGVTGNLTTRKFTDKNGNNRTAFEVVANNVQFVESKRTDGNEEGKVSPQTETDPLVDFQSKLDGFEVIAGDEDLPF